MEQEYSCPAFPHNLCKLNLSHCSLWPKASEKIWEAILKYEEKKITLHTYLFQTVTRDVE